MVRFPLPVLLREVRVVARDQRVHPTELDLVG